MGYYLEPKSGSSKADKKSFLDRQGVPIPPPKPGAVSGFLKGSLVLVCLIDNGPFYAAGVAFSDAELEVFLSIRNRPTTWYLLRKKDVDFLLPGIPWLSISSRNSG